MKQKAMEKKKLKKNLFDNLQLNSTFLIWEEISRVSKYLKILSPHLKFDEAFKNDTFWYLLPLLGHSSEGYKQEK